MVVPPGAGSSSRYASADGTAALVLDALLAARPEHPLIDKLARSLLDARRGGRWGSTQTNLVVLAALRRFYAIREAAEPAFAAKAWFGTAGYAEHTFTGRAAPSTTVEVPWAALRPGQVHTLTVAKTGPGRLTYRLAATYAPRSRALSALDAGFVVHRSYSTVDPSELRLRPDGSLQVKLGAQILVTVEVHTRAERFDVALVDELPAGFEAQPRSQSGSERALVQVEDDWDHINLRASRAEAFARRLPPGVRRHSYVVRAMTPGTFWAAPAHAEEMYRPETFGRSASAQVVIE
ncbi:MAG TPA: hypothetical protein PKU97_05690 [Kofleriaceae bacterium]|nr:hypothetical protein [Kofleriaceae bacterium]